MKLFNDLINPKSDKSSKRYVGIISLYALIFIAVIALIPYTIPTTNASLLESISYTLGGIVIGVFIGTVYEKRKTKVESDENNS